MKITGTLPSHLISLHCTAKVRPGLYFHSWLFVYSRNWRRFLFLVFVMSIGVAKKIVEQRSLAISPRKLLSAEHKVIQVLREGDCIGAIVLIRGESKYQKIKQKSPTDCSANLSSTSQKGDTRCHYHTRETNLRVRKIDELAHSRRRKR